MKLDEVAKHTVLDYLSRQGFRIFSLESEIPPLGYVPINEYSDHLDVYLQNDALIERTGAIVQPKRDFDLKYSWHPKPLRQLASNLRVFTVGSSLKINSEIAACLLSIPRESIDVYWISLKRVAP